jgi:hypothetical protein
MSLSLIILVRKGTTNSPYGRGRSYIGKIDLHYGWTDLKSGD